MDGATSDWSDREQRTSETRRDHAAQPSVISLRRGDERHVAHAEGARLLHRLPTTALAPAPQAERKAPSSSTSGDQSAKPVRLADDPRKSRRTPFPRRLADRHRSRGRLTEIVFLSDVALTLCALALAVRLQHLQTLHGVFGSPVPSSDQGLLTLAVLVIWPVVFSAAGLYRTVWVNSPFAIRATARALLIAALLISGIGFYYSPSQQLRWLLLLFIALDALLLISMRLFLRVAFRRQVAHQRVLVVGTGHIAAEAARAMTALRLTGLTLVGTVGPVQDTWASIDALEDWRSSGFHLDWLEKRLGDVEDTLKLIYEYEIDIVVVALPDSEYEQLHALLRSLAHLPIRVFVAPAIITEAVKTQAVVANGIPLLGLLETPLRLWDGRIKRILDLLISVPLLLMLTPLLLLIALVIRLNSSGSVIFRQERVGQHGRRFIMYKFRTMYSAAEVASQNRGVGRRQEARIALKRRADPRITPIGAILRRTSMDELPQLVNVIKGDMSLVGPRPELPWIVDEYQPWQYRRLLVPQGMTGWWQTHGRSDRVMHLHTQDDIYYVRNYSLWLDFKILLKTIVAVIRGNGAY